MERDYIRELVSFLTVRKDIRDDERQGRTSGSVEWRKQRGELGGSTSQEVQTCYVFKPNEDDVEAGRFRVRYCTATDTYYRGLEDEIKPGKYDIKGWKNGVYSMTSMLRKEEEDWRMTYLARQERSEFGSITWIVDFSKCEVELESITILASFDCFEDGEVKMELKEDAKQGLFQLLDGGAQVKTYPLSGRPLLTLTATLQSRGKDRPISWQHSQLFRQSLDKPHGCPLDIIITMKKKQT